jgi:hypothetical protein
MEIILKLLALLNFITNFYDKAMGLVSKSWSAVTNAHIPDVWVFTHRNATPWQRKETISNTLSFYPETQKFFKEAEVKKSMDDLVTAEILDASGIIVSDATEFFHNIRWSEIAPSVYEIVLLFFLLQDLVFPKELLSSYALRVMTIDAETLDIPLNNSKAFDAFSGWSKWAPLVARAPVTHEEKI